MKYVQFGVTPVKQLTAMPRDCVLGIRMVRIRKRSEQDALYPGGFYNAQREFAYLPLQIALHRLNCSNLLAPLSYTVVTTHLAVQLPVDRYACRHRKVIEIKGD